MFGHVNIRKKEARKIMYFQKWSNYTKNILIIIPLAKLEDLMIWLSIVIPLLKEASDHRDNECRIITAHIMDKNNPNKVIGSSLTTEIKL